MNFRGSYFHVSGMHHAITDHMYHPYIFSFLYMSRNFEKHRALEALNLGESFIHSIYVAAASEFCCMHIESPAPDNHCG